MPRMALARLLCPSYVSFHSALAWHGLIPERVEGIYSASYGKNRDKEFFTPLGEYRYLYLPLAAYPHGLLLEEEEGYRFLIASREKALCDALYKVGALSSIEDIEQLLWRIGALSARICTAWTSILCVFWCLCIAERHSTCFVAGLGRR